MIRHALDARLGKRLFHFVQLGRLYDRLDHFHMRPLWLRFPLSVPKENLTPISKRTCLSPIILFLSLFRDPTTGLEEGVF